MRFPPLKAKACLAPLAGYTDVAFRVLAQRLGAGMCVTELVSAEAILRKNPETLRYLQFADEESPKALQIFGDDPDRLVEAASMMEAKVDLIDLNCGCPAAKIVRGGAGAALLKDPARIGRIVAALVDALSVPVTVKIRLGPSKREYTCVAVAQAVEDAGGAAVTVHARPYTQSYDKPAEWEWIRKVKEAVSVPVLGNGDITSPERAKAMLDETGCDYVMIGRAAMGNPYIFRQTDGFLTEGSYRTLSDAERIALANDYLAIAEGFDYTMPQLKGQAQVFTKGTVGGGRLRAQLNTARTVDEIGRILTAVAGQTSRDPRRR
ncbi:tRNA dihydrouridine synthase DusB [Candidatus Woesearchaeota archaeon]|nr:tRNA dihydrouridine synthase DusB [Candidatus Woesearchaeota archaeon]